MTLAFAQLVALVDAEIRAQSVTPTCEDGVDLALELRHALTTGRDLDAREGERLQVLVRAAAADEAAAVARVASGDLARAVADLREQVRALGPLADEARLEAGRLAVATEELTDAAAALVRASGRFRRHDA